MSTPKFSAPVEQIARRNVNHFGCIAQIRKKENLSLGIFEKKTRKDVGGCTADRCESFARHFQSVVCEVITHKHILQHTEALRELP